MVQIEDDYGKKYIIEDLNLFKLHIKKYHSKDGKGDGSLHEETCIWSE